MPTAPPEPAPRQAKQSIKKSKKGRHKLKREPVNEDQDVATGGVRQTTERDAAMSEDHAKLHQIEALTSAAARAAKDYQAWMLGQMKTNIRAALEYANGLTSVGARPDLQAKPDAGDQGPDADSRGSDGAAPPIVKVADEYRAKAFELMNANINSTLDYAQRLVGVRTPTEFSELSTSHARKQMELIVKQATELGSIAQKLAASHVKRMTGGFVKTPDEDKE
jgi:hypothetical protein